MKKIIVFSDGHGLQRMLAGLLGHISVEIVGLSRFKGLLNVIGRRDSCALIFNLDKIPEADVPNMEVLYLAKRIAPGLPVIVISSSEAHRQHAELLGKAACFVKMPEEGGEFDETELDALILAVVRSLRDSRPFLRPETAMSGAFAV